MFGVEGELAGNALKAQRKALRTASISLILSFLAFTLMQCFFTLSGISTRETYFEKYRNVWDVMVTVRDAEVDSFEKIQEIQGIPEAKSAIGYQKATAKRIITEDEISEEMKSFGGFSHASGNFVTQTDGGWLINAPIVILDDVSFLNYCEQASISPRLDGAIIRNRIRDVTNPDFRHPRFMPYIKETGDERLLLPDGSKDRQISVPVLAYAQEEPALREEYASLDPYELVHFLPASLWEKLAGQKTESQNDTYILSLIHISEPTRH